MSKFYLTTPIYYVNAKPHIGHAYTTLAADVIARYQKQKRGEDQIFFLTGSDEHGAKVGEAATANKLYPKNFCDQIVPLFQKTWQNLGIQYNHFIRTTDPYHEAGAQEFLLTLKAKGALYEGNYSGLYCTGCESFLTPKQLSKNGNCSDHQKPPTKITEKNWFFKLNDYLDPIKKLIVTKKLKIEPAARKQEVMGLFKQGLTDFSVSRPNVKWGIPLPWDTKQTIYVWVEALLNYWTAIFKSPLSNAKLWPPDLQLIGKDIIKFHCIYWPAIILAFFDKAITKLPKKIFAHGFFTINGQKMSKSLGNVIDPNDLAAKYGIDGARYLILSQFPFGQDGDIEESRFSEKYNADLANGIGNLVARVTSLCLKQISNQGKFWQKLNQTIIINQQYAKLMKNLKLYEALKEIQNQISVCDEYLTQNKPWHYDKLQDQEKIINILSVAVKQILSINNQLEPFLPSTSKKIKQRLNLKEQKIKQGEPLFARK